MDSNGIQRYGTPAPGLPFSEAVSADGWLFVSGHIPTKGSSLEIVSGGIGHQARQAIENMIATLKTAGYGVDDVVKCGIWLADPRDFMEFNAVYATYFGKNPPARSCVVSQMVLDCKIEIDCVAYKRPT